MLIRRVLPALLAAVLLGAPPALAGTPGKWTMLGQANLANIDEVSLARTPDGTLHAVWTIPAANNDTLVHDAIAPHGSAAPPNVITGGWAAITPVPSVVATADGLRVFFGGIRTTNSNEVNQNMNTATAPASGAAWDLFPGTIVKGDSAYGADDGATLLPDGTPLLSFGGTGAGTFVHRGLDPGTPNFELQQELGGLCCGYSPDVAVDLKSGAPFVVWYSNATNKGGVWAQSLDPSTGQPTGPPANMPGSTTLFNGNQETSQQLMRTPIAARVGGGVYAAYGGGYPTTKKVLLWRIADSKSAVLGTSAHDHVVSLAAAPDGRLWVFWIERSSPPLVFARRSNKTATDFGRAVKLAAPPGQQAAYKIAGDAQTGTLDLVGLFGDVNSQAQWHTQVFPGLALKAAPAKISGGKSTSVKFTVSDPDPVKGAKVSAGGKSATTDAKGHATIDLGPTTKKSIAASATKGGYAAASAKVKVKH